MGVFDSRAKFLEWWNSPSSQQWWKSLPSTGGVWREVFNICASRFQSGFSNSTPRGVGNIFDPQPSQRAGYWGSYRSRIPDSVHDDFQPSSSFTFSKRQSSCDSKKIIPGRVSIQLRPENICFMREGQDYDTTHVTERGSRELRELRDIADMWLDFLQKSWDRLGGLSFRKCSGVLDIDLDSLENLNQFLVSENHVQIALFQSLGHVERIARDSMKHLRLHSSMTELYCPMGKFKNGGCGFWVEMGILHQNAVEAEYIGCYEGTGLMAKFTHSRSVLHAFKVPFRWLFCLAVFSLWIIARTSY